jgi:hypothetical protein
MSNVQGRGLPLPAYYAVEALNSMGNSIFITCSFFWSQSRFGYTDGRNLFMGAVQGIVYVLAARYGGRLADRMGRDRLIRLFLPGLIFLLGIAPLLHAAIVPVAITALYLAILAPTWPALESSILHAPSRLGMPTRLGLYNITWAFAGAFGLLVSGPLYAWRVEAVIWLPALLHLAAFACLRASRPATDASGRSAIDLPHRGHDVPAAIKRRFLHTSWLANAMSYFLLTSLTALAPELGHRLALQPGQALWLVDCIFFARAAAFLGLIRWPAWHYSTAWSQAALWVAPLSLAVIFLSREVVVVAGAMIVFGLAIGLSYFTSIYYSLDYGRGSGEHGGLHEAVLGVGMLLGPLVGALGTALHSTQGGQLVIVGSAALITAAGTAVILRSNRA